MVFPESLHHPTLSQAHRLKTCFSSLDRREMHRISRMLSDEVVFGTHRRWSSEYRTMWRLWMKKKGADMAIVFVNQSQ
ncbi:hypothetical protein ARMSODRAFT_953862 [Armillaria solidipes]|uniref:Uncharacterized protein n=1 Tax=Armillaria solidipes TaxID=1076256 RepID=A0A2H3BMP9_9AGAR|nr:hypothetical protein ARMSODRAFT_953862 [Armillaria solidipes]